MAVPVSEVAPSLDVQELLINLGILVGFIAAIVAGVWKGWVEIKKGIVSQASASSGPASHQVISATITETVSMAQLTESNRALRETICDFIRVAEDQNRELRENRYAIQETSKMMERMVSSLDHNSRTMERVARK